MQMLRLYWLCLSLLLEHHREHCLRQLVSDTVRHEVVVVCLTVLSAYSVCMLCMFCLFFNLSVRLFCPSVCLFYLSVLYVGVFCLYVLYVLSVLPVLSVCQSVTLFCLFCLSVFFVCMFCHQSVHLFVLSALYVCLFWLSVSQSVCSVCSECSVYLSVR